MAKTETITCDVCGVTKGTVNHWYMVSFRQAEGMKAFGWFISVWEQASETDPTVKHVCGQEHAHKLLDEFFQKVQDQCRATANLRAINETGLPRKQVEGIWGI